MGRPWLLLDVDGPLNPFRMDHGRAVARGFQLHQIAVDGITYPVLLDPGHGASLRELTEVVDLAWATTWEHDANRLLSPLLGLPSDLPVIEWPCGAMSPPSHGLCWKTPHVAAWVGARPFAWVDDDLSRQDRGWFTRRRDPASFLLRRIEPGTGLRRADFEAIHTWATSLTVGDE